MTTQELHIAIDILLQKINSNWNKNFLPQEKDFFINREVSKFIKQRFNPLSNNKRQSVFDIIKRLQDLNILFNTVTLPIISYNQKEDIVYLPFNYLNYISSETDVLNVCDKTPVSYNTVNTYTKEITSLSVIPMGNILIEVVINGISTTLFDLSALPSNYLPQDNIADYKKVFIYNNAIDSTVKYNLPNGLEFTFNKYTKRFIFKSNVPFVLLYNGNPVSGTTVTNSLPIIDNELVADVRITDEEYKSVVNKSYLSSSKADSAVGYLRNDVLILPKLNNAVRSSLKLTYICKPAKVDLLLGYNSNISDIVLEEVISNAVESMKAVLSSDTYEKFTKDNLLIE